MRIEWNKVTWYSKTLALVLFIALPFIGFYLGVLYEKAMSAAPAQNGTYFPPQPTQRQIDAAKKLPQDQCPCWDGTNNVCLPQQDCI